MDKTIIFQSSTLFYREEKPAAPAASSAPGASGSQNTPSLPAILLHGFAEDGRIWEEQIEYLKKDHWLIIPDLPGSGHSAPLPQNEQTGQTQALTIDLLAESIKAILDTANIPQCIFIGHSMGGYIALAFAEKYPERLKALGLFHSTAYADTEEKKEIRRKGIDFIRRNGAAPFIRQSTNLFSEYTRKHHEKIVTNYIEQNVQANPDGLPLIQYYEAMMKRPDRTHVLKDAKSPVLFIIGKEDNAVPLEQSLRQSHMPPISYIHILEQAGHMGMLEDKSGSNRALDNFLTSIINT